MHASCKVPRSGEGDHKNIPSPQDSTYSVHLFWSPLCQLCMRTNHVIWSWSYAVLDAWAIRGWSVKFSMPRLIDGEFWFRFFSWEQLRMTCERSSTISGSLLGMRVSWWRKDCKWYHCTCPDGRAILVSCLKLLQREQTTLAFIESNGVLQPTNDVIKISPRIPLKIP